MPSDPLPIAINAGHLTDVLRRDGVLTDGRVRDVVVESTRSTILSQITRLRLTCEGAPDSLTHLFLKTAHPDRNLGGAVQEAARQEVSFYSQVVPLMTARLVPHCYEAHWDDDPKAWRILLEDLSDSHVIATQWPLPPTMQQCESILRARARFHAAWWNDSRLGVSVGSRPDADALDEYLGKCAQACARFTDRFGDCLPRERRALFERFLQFAPRRLFHHRANCDVTIIQNDSHVWNCFLPREAGSDDVRLFDWDGWRIAPASDDHAYMMAVHWYPDLRREREQPLLDCYHATLLEHGVSGYDRCALDEDYRVSVLWRIMTPIWQATYEIPSVVWWNNLERILLAVDDLDCRALLD
jgi:hypothetical protein